jgi:FMN phosphatase YigB (HAD superfamily)
MAVRAVIMDLDGTLYRQAPVRRAMLRALIAHSAFHPAEGYRIARIIRAYRHAQESLRAKGEPASLQLAVAAEAAGCQKSLVEAVVRRWMEELPLPHVAAARYPGVAEFFRWAASAGITLAVLSDYEASAKLRALELESYVSVALSAADASIDRFKPDPTGLKRVLEAISTDPSQAVYIGDRPDVDGEAALRAGVTGFILNPRNTPIPQGLQQVPDWPSFHNLLDTRL